MGAVRIPSFCTKLSREQKEKAMREMGTWKNLDITEYLRNNLEDRLDSLIKGDEKHVPGNEFEHTWGRVKSLAKRELLRELIKDLT